ncbi:MAG TPA: hypothetical protein VGO09_06010, partial [Flavisolibacter sp.]|nr:hypothetical protein [Flavisolibacter sp.]
MKIVIIFAALLVSFTCNSQTGMNTKKHPAKHSNAKAAPDKKIQTQQANNSGYLYSNTNNNAFATRPVLANHYEISDPTLKALNARS